MFRLTLCLKYKIVAAQTINFYTFEHGFDKPSQLKSETNGRGRWADSGHLITNQVIRNQFEVNLIAAA